MTHRELSPNDAEPDRVRRRTAPDINRRIDAAIEKNIRLYAAQPREVITRRIQELEREWDMERILEANASSLALFGLVLGIAGRRGWLGLPVVVLGFLLNHAIEGWCPPVPAFRRAGVRTRSEIDREKCALKFLRGDFDGVEGISNGAEKAGQLVAAMAR